MSILSRLLGRPEIELTPEQKLTQEQISISKRQIDQLKRLESRERRERVRKQLSWAFRKTVPKGIRHPDSTVANIHLYLPGRKGKTNLR